METRLPLIQEANLAGKVVLVRVDHNVVKSGLIEDTYRIDSTIGTISYILAKGGKIILMTHVGRPVDKLTKAILINEKTSVLPIVNYLREKLCLNVVIPNISVSPVAGYDCLGSDVQQYVEQLKKGEIDILYLPNTRWFKGEEAKGEAQMAFGKELASLADIYVNDAFGSWQAHASTAAVNKYLPSYAGFLMQKEIKNLEKIFKAQTPLVSVIAGSKFDTKIESLNALLNKSDYLVLGGVIYNAYLCAKYNITIKGVDEADIKAAKDFINYASKFSNKIVELPYIIESDIFENKIQGQYRTHNIHNLTAGTALNFVLDIDALSFEDKAVKSVFNSAKTIFINAVMGFTPNFIEGTIALDTLIDTNKEAVKLYGGGDTVQELKNLVPQIYLKAIDDPKYYMFTGGGAVLKAIEQNTHLGIPTIEALIKK